LNHVEAMTLADCGNDPTYGFVVTNLKNATFCSWGGSGLF
jgi:hypothetical protein